MDEMFVGAPPQQWSWLRPVLPKRLQPLLRGLRKRIKLRKTHALAEPFRTIYPYTQVHLIRQKSLLRLGRLIEEQNIPGACIECGVLDGGTAALIAHATAGSGRAIHLFDAWQGLPEATAEDGDDAKQWAGQVVGSPRRVRNVLSALNIDPQRVHFHKGWFNETFPQADIPAVALAHIDCDFYEPTKLCLERWYGVLSAGGYMQFDDYAAFQGCRKAVDEFLAAHRELKLQTLGEFGAKAYYFQKPPLFA
jgi:O-methyltransferase